MRWFRFWNEYQGLLLTAEIHMEAFLSTPTWLLQKGWNFLPLSIKGLTENRECSVASRQKNLCQLQLVESREKLTMPKSRNNWYFPARDGSNMKWAPMSLTLKNCSWGNRRQPIRREVRRGWLRQRVRVSVMVIIISLCTHMSKPLHQTP